MNSNDYRFIELQYDTLRKEIETSKSNMFKLIIGGSAVIPTAQSIANTYSIGVITLALPLVVVVLVLLFLSENHAMMRAGTYISEEIETKIEGVKGWETWLSSTVENTGKRTVDKLLVFAFAILASSYFIVSVLLAARYAHQEFGQQGRLLISAVYIGIGGILVYVLYSQAQTDTKCAQNFE